MFAGLVLARALKRIRNPNPLFKTPVEQLLLSPRVCTSPRALSFNYTLEFLGACVGQLRLHNKVPQTGGLNNRKLFSYKSGG